MKWNEEPRVYEKVVAKRTKQEYPHLQNQAK